MRSSTLSRISISALLAIAAPALAPAQSFTDISAGLTNVHHGSSIWGDYNDDGDLDALITGETAPPLAPYADIYSNTGGVFTALSAGLTGITGSSGVSRSAWGDYDNDGDLDVVITGQSGFSGSAKLYENTGGAFAAVTVAPSAFPNIALGSAAWGDYDNDGDLDLFLTGYNGGLTLHVTTVYRNDGPAVGGWTFTDVDPFASIPNSKRGWSDGAWGDYDNDGDLDLITIGFRQLGIDAHTQLYRNDGGVLVLSAVTNLVNVGEGSVTWGDVNNDNWLDLVITGGDAQGSNTRYCRVYTNNQNGTFTQSASLFGVMNSSAALGDYNNDGKLDLVYIGEMPGYTPVSLAYFGNGNGTFTQDLNSGLTDVYEGQVSFGDYDNDGRLDLIITGRDVNVNNVYTKVYHNTTGVSANTLPTTPTGLTATAVNWNSITVQWNLSSDAQSGNHLHYNLKVRDLTAGTTVEAPMANAGTGYRHVPQLGNTNLDTKWTITGLASGHQYQFCVQAIDQAYAASPFNCGLTVTTGSDRPDVMIGDCLADVGAEPNSACGTVYYNSPNIWLRNIQDGTVAGNDVSQNPVVGTNYIYARVTNIGSALLTSGRVYFYFAKAATVFNWPQHWTGNYNGAVLEGDLIGYADVSNLSGGGGSDIVWVQWPNTPNFQHFCILARFVASSDPMTFTEGIQTIVNTQNNNNIAWRNITRFSTGGVVVGPVGVYNTAAEAATIGLRFNDPDPRAGDPVVNHVKVKYILGEALFSKWRAGGSRGTNVEVVKNDDGSQSNAVWIKKLPATLDGIRLEAGDELTTNMEIVYPAKVDQAVAGRVYSLDLAQYDNGADAPSGGEFYEIEMPTGPRGKTVVTGALLGSMLELTAHPNPTSSSLTIGYSLPADTRVTIALYDASGKLVRTLVDRAEQNAGRHEVEWDGAALGGEPVPSGAYFYRVETSSGAAQGQVRITR